MSYVTLRNLLIAGKDGIELPSIAQGLLNDPVPEHVDRRLFEYIVKNFEKVECGLFRSTAQENVCECGNIFANHTEEAKAAGKLFSSSPSNSLQLETKVSSPTDAFGEINFGGRTNSSYVRLSSSTEASAVLELMRKYWTMDKPNLLLSVTGGAQNFTMKPRLKEVFRQGFIKAAQSTGAWIITGGMNAGVMKHVGEAVRDYTLKHGRIAPWGCILNRESLMSSTGTGCWPANYSSVASSVTKECPLDPNHSHFILVDDSTSGKYGSEITLRAELERAVSNSPTYLEFDSDESVAIPIVSIVLEGGPNSIETVKNAIACGTPAIIVQGSGRVADILAHAYNNAVEVEIVAEDQLGKKHKQLISIVEQWLEKELMDKIKSELKTKSDEQAKQILENVKICVSNRDFMTVFDLDGKDCGSDIDITILKALLKSNKGKKIDQLKLALAWNRADVAREQIFTDDAIFEIRKAVAAPLPMDDASLLGFFNGVIYTSLLAPPEDLYDLMYKALIQNKVEFVKLLISRGVSLKEFATVPRILSLLNEPLTRRNCKHLFNISESTLVSLKHVGQLVQDLMGHYYEHSFCKPPYKDIEASDYVKTSNIHAKKDNPLKSLKIPFNTLRSGKSDKRLPLPEFEDPSNVLFLWCVLVHMKDMSLVFLDIGKEDIAMALMAQHISKSLLQKEQDSDFAVNIQNQIEYFGNLALGVLNECYSVDQSKATLLLVRQMSSFGETTVLKMAVQADHKEFVAHPACQNLLTNIWTDQLSDDNNYIWIILALLMPFLSPILLNFRQKEIRLNNAEDAKEKALTRMFLNKKRHNSDARREKNVAATHILIQQSKEKTQQKAQERNFVLEYWDKLESFFKAPFTTFCYNCIAYFAFLLLFGVILLTNFFPVYGKQSNQVIPIEEIILIAWVSTFLLEEIRQFIVTESSHPGQKLFNYISDPWNVSDIISIATFYIGLTLRFIPTSTCERCFYAGRIVLAFNLMMFFLRVLHMFSVHQQLGPKLVMIKQMMVDLFYFVIIIMVFISSYGITSQVILYPNQELNIKLARDVLSDAWWNVYGQLDIDMVSDGKCSSKPDVCDFNSTTGKCKALDCAVYGYESDKCYGKEDNCVANDWVVPILLAIYALITNVMMLNLLIAMFSNTFAAVQGQSNVVWKMQRYHLIQEFESRPIWPPPLIIIGHVYQFIRYMVFDRCCRNQKSTKIGFRMKLNKVEEKELINWENIYSEEYLLNNETTAESSMEFKINETFKKSDDVMFKLDQLSESSLFSQTTSLKDAAQTKLPPLLEKRFAQIEEQLKQNAQALTLLMDHLKISREAPEEVKLADVTGKEDVERRQVEIKKKKELETERLKEELKQHKLSRSAVYPVMFEAVVRFPVPDNKVSWKVAYPSYKPPSYTSDEVLDGNYDEENMDHISFNAVDQMRRYDRRSCTGRYDIVDGFPLNPRGRTGLKGRGSLNRWGPNHIYKLLLTRWADSEPTSIKPKKYLQFLAVEFLAPGHKIIIPELLYPETSNPTMECLQDLPDAVELKRWLREEGDHVTHLFEDRQGSRDYYDDPRNTDNAWLEVSADIYHDEDVIVLTNEQLGDPQTIKDDKKFTWVRIHRGMDVYAADLPILKTAVNKLKASF
ncbi:hypothetical protein HELRODRAFT_190762 [Helobdella robusta]|uniref:TRPM SLOG domain-containing protein n=1 Tax=Helobdella robusta TaxID=6412 RepID=T1FS99_HELRO|nr:hypothetical protein HELRODRAFT_190762 [Helobdella robusta]ESO08545.1 hypothetical protein HELRODRAFT_190762 [Helobdella robusta]